MCTTSSPAWWKRSYPRDEAERISKYEKREGIVMFEKVPTFACANRRRVLFLAVIGAVIADVFGASVASRLTPYGVDEPATQSVQAKDRFQAATGRQIDPGVVALVSSGDVRSPAARQRVDSIAAELRAQPDVATVQSVYTTHDPAMVARDGRSTYVVAYFKARSDLQISNDAKLIESRFSSQRDVKLGGDAIAKHKPAPRTLSPSRPLPSDFA
jgi:uncharacterized membrane protein YdfJ with MMPL/SSD domain